MLPSIVVDAASVASVLGLFASLASWWNADQAKRAANDARRSVRLGNTAEALLDLSTRSTELLSFVEVDDPSSARLRSRDLLSAVSRARLRYERFISQQSKTALADASSQIQVIARELATTGMPTTAEGKNRLLRFCHSVHESLNRETGRIMSQIEKEEE